MNVDYLLDHFDDDAGHKEEVALLIYYLENEDQISSVSQEDVRNVIQSSRSVVSSSSLSTYFSRLKKSEWITEANGDGYILTHDGEDGVEELLDDEAFEAPREDLFIHTEVIDEHYYDELIESINRCYQHRIYDATLVLTRKFFEHLVYKILQGHYGGDDVEMFFDTDRKLQLGFEDLVKNLRDGVPDLRQYSRDLSKDLVDDLDQFREHGNDGAHSIRVNVEEDEIEEMAKDATRLAQILYDVYLGVRIASN